MTVTTPSAPNKIFGIAIHTMTDPETGRTVPHAYGAIFDVDANGRATDCCPIDFDGMTIRTWKRDNYGKAKNDRINDHLVSAEKALFFPITADAADRLKEAMADLTEAVNTGRNPFYYTGGSPFYSHVERTGYAPVNFDGSEKHVTQTKKQSFQRSRFERPRSPTNCMRFLRDVAEKVGGIPLDALQLEGKVMPHGGNTYVLRDFIDELSGNLGKPYMKWTKGRLINMGEGRYAFACGHSDTTGNIYEILNTMPKQRTKDGCDVPLTQFLLNESQPFSDPSLIHPEVLDTCQIPARSR